MEKNAYRPYVQPNLQTLAEPVAEPVRPAAPIKAPGLWRGCAVGAGSAVLLALIAGLLLFYWQRVANQLPREVTESPFWTGFQSKNVVVAVGTPLFFRSKEGFERSFGINLPDDLGLAQEHLQRWPAFHHCFLFTPLEDEGAAINLDRYLYRLNSTFSLLAAHPLHITIIAAPHTI